jgi:hypothetical protein
MPWKNRDKFGFHVFLLNVTSLNIVFLRELKIHQGKKVLQIFKLYNPSKKFVFFHLRCLAFCLGRNFESISKWAKMSKSRGC